MRGSGYLALELRDGRGHAVPSRSCTRCRPEMLEGAGRSPVLERGAGIGQSGRLRGGRPPRIYLLQNSSLSAFHHLITRSRDSPGTSFRRRSSPAYRSSFPRVPAKSCAARTGTPLLSRGLASWILPCNRWSRLDRGRASLSPL